MTALIPHSIQRSPLWNGVKKQVATIMLLLTFVFITVGVLFTSQAQADGQGVCKDITIMSNSNGDNSALHEKLHQVGTQNIHTEPLNTKTAHSVDTPCVIMQYSENDTPTEDILNIVNNNPNVEERFR